VKKLQAHELRQIAVAAQCDPRTVEKYLSGKLSKGVLDTELEATGATSNHHRSGFDRENVREKLQALAESRHRGV
jgi:hypothetical protein